MQYVFLWASGEPNPSDAPGSPHSSYATAHLYQKERKRPTPVRRLLSWTQGVLRMFTPGNGYR